MNEIEKHIQLYAGQAGRFSIEQLGGYLDSINDDVPTASLYYYLNRLIEQNYLARISRGEYAAIAAKPEFNAVVTEDMRRTFNVLHKELPFADFCLYYGTEITPFQHNMAANNVLYVETQRDTCNSAFNILKETGRTVYLHPDREMINRYVDLAGQSVFIKPLTSESPLKDTTEGLKVPTLEKLLVDINADEDFFYLQGEEAFYIFRNASERFCLNSKRLLRYARRRNLEQTMKKYMEDLAI